jgi:hypothetical protein
MIGDAGRDQVSCPEVQSFLHRSIEGIGPAFTTDGAVVCEYAEGWLRDDEIDTAGFCAAIRGKPISDNDNDLRHDEPSPRTQAPPAG